MLIYSSFFGGTGAEQAFDIALDPSGNIYLTGKTLGGGTLPVTPGAQQASPPGLSDAFVAKFNADRDGADLLHLPRRHRATT